MGTIRVTPSEVAAAGDRIQSLAPVATSLSAVAASSAQCATDPPATAAALGECASTWASALGRLTDELLSVGGSAQAAAVLYAQVDGGAMGGGGR